MIGHDMIKFSLKTPRFLFFRHKEFSHIPNEVINEFSTPKKIRCFQYDLVTVWVRKIRKTLIWRTTADFQEVMFCSTKSLISQVKVLQFLQFKNQDKLNSIPILMMCDIGISRRFYTFGQYFKVDRPLNWIFSPIKLTQLFTNQLKIGFVYNIYVLNLFQLANTNFLMPHLLNLDHY